MRKAQQQLKYGRLVELLRYDRQTGEFTWRFRRGNVPAGSVAGHINASNGYREIGIDGVSFLAHRLAWFYMTGEWPSGETVDHKNRRPDDNWFDNLRNATFKQNNSNRPARRDNELGVKGVSRYHRDPNRFVAQICLAGKQTNLGIFETVEAASAAYRAAAETEFGEFAHA